MQTDLKQVKLMEGSYQPAMVRALFVKSIDGQINHLKLKNLSDWVKNHQVDQNPCLQEIARLKSKKQELLRVIAEAEMVGCNLKVNDQLDISFES